ncbi:MAG: hypothetical protein KHW95_07085 [Firmicutes bacterium]|nr:hypothetical protein [Bacillota bacterium]
MDQINIFDYLNNDRVINHDSCLEVEDSESLARSKISCCSRYRQCSDSGKCLVIGTDIARSCRYRVKLESGDVFFGKRTKYFSKKDFDYCCGQVQLMDDEEREVFYSCLYHFCDRCYSTCYTYKTKEIMSLAKRELIRVYPFPIEMVRLLSKRRALVDCLKKNGAFEEYNAYEKKVKAELDTRGEAFDGQPLCAEYILNNHPDYAAEYLSDLCSVDISLDARLKYMDEFYIDCVASNRQPCDLPNPLLTDPRFRKKDRKNDGKN